MLINAQGMQKCGRIGGIFSFLVSNQRRQLVIKQRIPKWPNMKLAWGWGWGWGSGRSRGRACLWILVRRWNTALWKERRSRLMISFCFYKHTPARTDKTEEKIAPRHASSASFVFFLKGCVSWSGRINLSSAPKTIHQRHSPRPLHLITNRFAQNCSLSLKT